MTKSFNSQKPWRLYERIAAAIKAENSSIEMSITPNAKIIGTISGLERQIDILIDARWGDDTSKRIIIDAKLHRDKLDINDVEAFEGMMRDCRASRGILISPRLWTEGARRRAQDAITIELLSIEDIETTTFWAHFDNCMGKCFEKQRKKAQSGLVLWDAHHLLVIDGLYMIAFTGKCDVCHNFHIWCWDCGEKFALEEEGERPCSCGHQWISIIEEETSDVTHETLNAVHLFLLAKDSVWPLDRRSLR